MKTKKIVLLFIVALSIPVTAQQINYQKTIDSLQALKNQYTNNIKQIDSEIKTLNQKIILQLTPSSTNLGINITLSEDAKFRTTPSPLGDYKIIPEGSQITLLEYSNLYWKIIYNQEIGYINEMYVRYNQYANDIKEAIEANKSISEIEKIRKEQIEADKRKMVEEENEQKGLSKSKATGSPIHFISAEVTFNTIGNPEASISVKNISDKTIDAYDVNIYCYNRYGNPVNHYAYSTNKFGGISQETIKPDERNSSTWTLYGYENTTKIKVVLEKVHFTNGKTWYPKGKAISIEGVSDN